MTVNYIRSMDDPVTLTLGPNANQLLGKEWVGFYRELFPRKSVWAWVGSGDADAVHLVRMVAFLLILVIAYAVLRYLREVSNQKMSMNMVYYLREAIYDKLQRVGFGFHDALSTGQLINRALTDLQNVRTFIQTAVLTTMEI